LLALVPYFIKIILLWHSSRSPTCVYQRIVFLADEK